MPKKAIELGPLQVKRLTEPGLHAVGGVAGLHMQVMASGARSWVLRVMVGAKRRDMGLGGYPDVPLQMARERAREARETIAKGLDPVEQRKAARRALRMQQAVALTFKQAAEQMMEARAPSWANRKHEQQWRNTLQQFAYPVLGDFLVRDIGQKHVLAVLRPIWTRTPETASRLRGRIEQVLAWSGAQGLRDANDNPARWRGRLDQLLPPARKIAKRSHHRALPIEQVPEFMQRLAGIEGTSAVALRFLTLTAARSGEVRGMTWAEIDKRSGLWVVPAERMKAKREHRVPLSTQALQLLAAQPRIVGVDYVFPSPRGLQLSDMALTQTMRRMGVDAVPHGQRAVFRSWCAEQGVARELAEAALAHTIESKVEAAYIRSDVLERRRELMQQWADYCTGVSRAKVVPMKRRSK